MRALRAAEGRVAMSTVPDPSPAPGEAVIRPLRTVLPDVLPSQAGITPGSDFVGVVAAINLPVNSPQAERARNLKGKRVVGSVSIPCKACDLCRGGLSQHCRSRQVLGATRDGTLADAFVLPIANLTPVPDAVDDDRAALARLVAAAVHASQLVRLEAKTYVTVLGDSPRALLVAQVMAKLNASVRVLGDHEPRLSLCERWGVKHRLRSDVGKRQDQDVVVDCTASAPGLLLALQLVRPRGRIIMTHAPAPAPAQLDLSALVDGELELLGCRGGPLDAALDLLANRQVHVEPLIARRIKLDAAPAALAQRDPAGLLTLVEP